MTVDEAVYRSKSYEPCDCNFDCQWDNDPAQPCWGKVTIYEDIFYDDDGTPNYDEYHACEGHLPFQSGLEYLPEPK